MIYWRLRRSLLKQSVVAIKCQSLIAFLIFNFTLTTLAAPVVIGNISLDQNINTPQHIPENLKQVPEVYISRNEYLISFNPSRRLLNWAAWKLEASDLGHIGRTNVFLPDPDLQTYLNQFNQQAAMPEDYKGSCFDKGHQVPSADRDTSVDVNKITFLMSNMMPQTAYLNRVIWEHLEQYTRNLVINENKKVYIIAGPIFDEDFGAIGPKLDIPVPSKNFKVIIVLEQNQTFSDINSNTRIISVIMPNLLKSGKKPLDDKQELCAESVSLNQPVKANPPTIPQPAPLQALPSLPTSMQSSNLEIDPLNPVVTNPVLTDWMQYQVPFGEVENLSGFKIVPQLIKVN